MQSIFVLQHTHVMPSGEQDVKLIGVYSSYEAAEAAVARLIAQPGFRDFPTIVDPLKDEDVSGFNIDEYRLDQDQWREGFVTM